MQAMRRDVALNDFNRIYSQSTEKLLDGCLLTYHTEAGGFSIARARCRQPLLFPQLEEELIEEESDRCWRESPAEEV